MIELLILSLTAFDLSSETSGTAKLARMVADNTLNTVPRVDVDVTNASFRGQVLPGVVSALNKLRLTSVFTWKLILDPPFG